MEKQFQFEQKKKKNLELLTNIVDPTYTDFSAIVYNRAMVFKRQNFIKVVVHVIIIDQ